MIRAGAVLLFTPLTAILTQRGLVDPRLQAAIGFVLLSASNWWLGSITTPLSDFHSLVFPLILSGIGLAQIFVPLSVSVIGSVPDKEVPSTAAFFNLSRQIGGSVAAAILITLLVRGFTVHQTELASQPNARARSDPAVRALPRWHSEHSRNAAPCGPRRVAVRGRIVRRHVALGCGDHARAGTARALVAPATHRRRFTGMNAIKARALSALVALAA